MNVLDMKKLIADLPDDMELVETRFSDFDNMKLSDWSLVEAVPTDNGWIMRSHHTMSDENKSKQKTYLHFRGN